MVSVFFRTIIIYLFLLLTMRLMGKRQIGELQISELIVTFMLSELAVNPIANPNMPLLHALIPILLLLSIEVILSFWMTKSVKLRQLLSGTPTVLIRKGVLDQRAMADNRLEIDELLSELRQNGVGDPAQVQYAILEDNGKLSVFVKSDPESGTENGIAHPVVVDGQIQAEELGHAGKNENWLRKELAGRNTEIGEVFLMTVSDGGVIYCVRRDKK